MEIWSPHKQRLIKSEDWGISASWAGGSRLWRGKNSESFSGTLPLLLAVRTGVHGELVVAVASTYHESLPEIVDINWVKLSSLKNQRLHSSSLSCTREVVIQVLLTLNATVGDFADFLWVKPFPRLSIQILVKRNDKDGVDKIDEGISDVAVILQINW